MRHFFCPCVYCVFAVIEPHCDFVYVCGTICFYLFHSCCEVIPNVCQDTLTVFFVVIACGMCISTYIGVCILVLGFLYQGNMDLLFTEQVCYFCFLLRNSCNVDLQYVDRALSFFLSSVFLLSKRFFCALCFVPNFFSAV